MGDTCDVDDTQDVGDICDADDIHDVGVRNEYVGRVDALGTVLQALQKAADR
ncbi:hypothetical protein [Paenibacillus hexagrammi]|uniref:Uncharacterized protein n=1 Tax=Paenibacillus hexagrammi TaxID=2908839 RepID=A0ABY3SHL6_9BACL|nr:hypothetical protein [Paenibacillus sp. YPD9-1]UJF33377.1 hypothetical protein L0M14_28355 [Paenibacillus sp. YPD9-1]